MKIRFTKLFLAIASLLASHYSVAQCTVTPNYIYTPGQNGQVSFTGSATGTTGTSAYYWDFGDGTFSWGTQVVHTYTSNATYTVIFTAYSNSPTPVCSGTLAQNVTITNYSCYIDPSFTYQPVGGGVYNFGKTGTSGVNYNWNFGDGTGGTGVTTTHTYTNAGIYSASLTASNLTCTITSAAQQITVNSIPCVPDAGFSAAPTSTPQYWTVTPSYPWNVIKASWDWGDGTSADSLYAAHSYSAAGTYSICLSVTVSCGGSTTNCVSQFINKSNETSAMINVQVVKPQLTRVPNTNKEQFQFRIYPDPSTGKFFLQINETGPVNVSLHSIAGSMVYRCSFENTDQGNVRLIDTGNIQDGVYFMNVHSGQKTLTRKIIISK